MISDQWAGVIGSVVRFLLGSLVGGLIAKGVVTADQGQFILLQFTAVVVAIVGLAWAYAKNKAQAKLIRAALDATPGTPLEVVKDRTSTY